jgi:hypothetical protein
MQTLNGLVFGFVGMGAMYAAYLAMINSWKKEMETTVSEDREFEFEPEPVSVMKTTDKQLVKLRRIDF